MSRVYLYGGAVSDLLELLPSRPDWVLVLPGSVEVRWVGFDSFNGLDIFEVAGDPDPYDATLVLDKARELGAW